MELINPFGTLTLFGKFVVIFVILLLFVLSYYIVNKIERFLENKAPKQGGLKDKMENPKTAQIGNNNA